MNMRNHSTPQRSDLSTDVAKIMSALQGLKPRRQAANEELFGELYPSICETLQRRVSKKNLIATLSGFGLRLSPTRFNKMLADEAKRRGDTLPLAIPSRSKASSLVASPT
jgi:hypothetical protein